MTRTIWAAIGIAAAAVCLGTAVPGVCGGLFGRHHLPRINVGRGIKAVLSPVGRVAVGGGKAVVGVGRAAVGVGATAVKDAPAAAATYEEWHNAPGKAGTVLKVLRR